MSESVNLPALGESVTEGTVTRWLKNVGEHVDVDEPLLEVSTDKVDTEIPSPISGVIEEILVQEDETVDVGTPLVRIGDGSGSAPTGSVTPEPEEEATPAAEAPEPVSEQPEAAEQTDESTAGTSYTGPSDEQESAAADQGSSDQGAPQQGSEQAPSDQGEQASSDQGGSDQGGSTSGEGLGDVAPSTEASTDDAATQAPAEVEAPAAESKPDHEAVQPAAEASAPAAGSSEPTPAAAGSAAAAGYVTPIVRKLAGEHGIDLSSIEGSGVGGRIRKEDVLAAVEKKASAPAEAPTEAPAVPAKKELVVSELRGTTKPMTRLRKVVAERAVVSMQSTAQLTSVVEVDVTKVAQLRTKVKDSFLEKTGVKLSFLPFFALAAAEALKSYPIINATVDGDSIVYPETENVSIAVDTERGLLTPVVRDAGSLDIVGLAQQIADLASRTRENKLKPDELSGGTFTLTNTGSRGALFDTPLVFLPQVAILGTGIVTKKPVVITADGSDSIAIRSTVYLALSYDHRIVDGADAARFLVQVKDRLEAGDFQGDLGI